MTFASLDLTATERQGAVARAAAARPDGVVEIVEGAAGVASIEAAWREISASARDGAVFLGFGYGLAAARYHEARGEQVAVALVRYEGRPACILPVAIARRSGVKVGVMLGDPITQYSDALIARHAPSRLAKVALKALSGHAGVDALVFRRVRSDAAFLPALACFASPCGSSLEAPFADLTAGSSIDELLLGIGGAKQRRERARSRRRLAERGEVRFEALKGSDAADAIREAFALKADWLARSGVVSGVVGDDAAAKVLEEAARDPMEGGALFAGRLTVGGAVAAYEIGFLRGKRFHAYLGAVTEAFAGASPGKIAMEETFGWCRAQGLDIYDLLPPGDRYKREWSNGSVYVRDYAVARTTLGRVYAGPWLRFARPVIRRAFDALPPSLRARVGRAALKSPAS